VSDGTTACKVCGAEMPPEASACPRCRAPRLVSAPPTSPSEPKGKTTKAEEDLQALLSGMAGRAPRPSGSGKGGSTKLSPRLDEHFQRLQSWQEGARRLGVEIPLLPGWAREAASNAQEEDKWEETLRGLERVAHVDITRALEAWQKETASRITRLEAYGIPSPNEKKQLTEVGRTSRAGDLTRALELYQKVDKVVTLKERALDEVRDAVEAFGALVADLQAVGLPLPTEDTAIVATLEKQLRQGKVGEVRTLVTELREKAQETLTKGLPALVNEAAERTAGEKAQGKDVSQDVGVLARSARALRRGKMEEALRGIVKLRNQRLLDPFALAEDEATGSPQ
jgi:hypothetical protein